nr:recombinase family protein [uncultured Acetatifactor sp.]
MPILDVDTTLFYLIGDAVAKGFTGRKGNVFNVLTIRHILENPKYKGWYCANKSQTVDCRSKRKIFLNESEWVMYLDPAIPAIVSGEL